MSNLDNFERLGSILGRLTAKNALEVLGSEACPRCHASGQFAIFHEPNNNGLGLWCQGCGERHPFQPKVMWLRQGAPQRSDNIQTVMAERGFYCWLCSSPYETLRARGIGMHVHHTQPFAYGGEEFPKIPLCALCHEIATAVQRQMRRLLDASA